MGIDPETFWNLHYSELCLILEGYQERQRKEHESARWGRAWLGSIIALSAGAKDITPAKLLGEKERKPRKRKSDWVKMTPESATDAVNWLLGGREHGEE